MAAAAAKDASPATKMDKMGYPVSAVENGTMAAPETESDDVTVIFTLKEKVGALAEALKTFEVNSACCCCAVARRVYFSCLNNRVTR